MRREEITVVPLASPSFSLELCWRHPALPAIFVAAFFLLSLAASISPCNASDVEGVDGSSRGPLQTLLQDDTFQSVFEQLGSALPDPSRNTSHLGSSKMQASPPQLSSQDDKLEALFQNSAFQAAIDRFMPVLPPAGYAVDQRGLSCISVPPKPNGAILAENPDGWSKCLVADKIKDKIPSSPGFPAPLAHPPKVHRIGSAPGKGLGIFATHDLDVGDLIYAERPLLVLPSCTKNIRIGYPQDWTGEQVEWTTMFVWNQQCYRAFERLEPEAQDAFLSLRLECNSVFRPKGLCLLFLRHAAHQKRKEMAVAYGVLDDIRSVRQQDHRKYMFDCNCPACGPDFEISDQNHLDTMNSGDGLNVNYTTWLEDKTLAEDEVIKTSRRWIKVIESEGLGSLAIYRRHLGAIHRAYVALGDKENAIKYGVPSGKIIQGRWGAETFYHAA
ncbi:hypothetical protein BD779DRAFT_1677572 [Infundibulicybe gibba]|nr:hypothetical protein BD779DRAFT_1677572 [Infundibulicybe gibba]